MRPEAIRGSGAASRRWSLSDSHGMVLTIWSAGLPNMYFGTTHAPLRVETNTFSATPLRDSSEAMSTALLPMPTTSTRLPRRSSGSVVSM